MSSNLSIESFEYFLECYFNQSFGFEDLEALTYEYRFREPEKFIIELFNELKKIKSLNDWEFVRKVVKTKSGKDVMIERLKSMVDIMLEKLKDRTWNKEKHNSIF